MKETWRWFGPNDPIPLDHIKQAGATGIVTALHHLYRGEPWPLDDVLKRRDEIVAAGFDWSVVESIPIHNSIKLRSGPYEHFVSAWKDSLAAVAQAGVAVVCYNFMPVVDWTRTDLRWRLPTTGYALRFDTVDFAAYDLFILERKGAGEEYSEERIRTAQARFNSMSEARKSDLERTIIAGLPGAEASYNRETIRSLIADYHGMTVDDLRSNLIAFQGEIVPVAQELGVRLAIHPDDPPWPLFGLPRVVSTAEDVRAIFSACDIPANGLTFCVGSFGARADNDLLAMAREFGARIHFAHLRQVTREPAGSFHEAEHLAGSSDMVGVIRVLLEEEARRRQMGRADHEISMRPDHGHLLADDVGKKVNPGYSLVGRLKGLAELRGVMQGLKHAIPELSD
ncbi:MAG TPA: mannonate dehydratase [Candidatus Deferrimicrobiaceae bacterium]|nr:mannonate dehydratase [Candidatus Deferrimicrobiaceae bacterium]